MFEDKNFEEIQKNMMASFNNEIRTDEASLAYNACCKIAEKLEDIYADMSFLYDNILPDTQDLDHLIRFAAEHNVEYRYATKPIVKAVFNQNIDIGESFTCNDYTYIVSEHIEDYTYKLECQTVGTEANTNIGVLDPISYIEGYDIGKIVEILIKGEDDEDEEVFRKRVMDSFQNTSFSGNKAAYRTYIDKIPGVGGCKPMRVEEDSVWIYVYLINSDYTVPSSELIAQVQDLVDPTSSHGEGDGIAPIDHYVKIAPVQSEKINIETHITFDTGYSISTSKSAIESAIESYLSELRKSWEVNEKSDTIIRIAQIESRLLNIPGILDVDGTKINDKLQNMILSFDYIPLKGEIKIV